MGLTLDIVTSLKSGIHVLAECNINLDRIPTPLDDKGVVRRKSLFDICLA